MLKRVVYPAYAKLNLTLSVAAPEAPGTPRAGWHRIASWFHAIELHDDVTVSRLKDELARVRVEWAPDAPRPTPIDWPVEKDLAARAHALLEKTLARRLSCEIVVSKRIPVGGGLGGGSSDAAATLVALNRLFSLGQSVEQLQKIGGELGSDVAFFIDEREMPRPAIVLAFGDVIERRARLSGPVELFVPDFGCETRAVYQAFDRLIDAGHPLRGQSVRDIAARAEESGRFDGAGWFNDLRKAADAVSGGKLSAIERAIGTEAPVLMSGSGSTLFVLGETRVGALPAGTVRVSTRLV